jgi:hypothetical protein
MAIVVKPASINFCNNLQFCSKVYNFYDKSIASKDLNIILNGSVKLLGQTLIDIFNSCSLNKINSIFKNNSEILDKLINNLKMNSSSNPRSLSSLAHQQQQPHLSARSNFSERGSL